MKKIKIHNQTVSVDLSLRGDDYLSLTDMAKYRNGESPKKVIQNWMRNLSTVEFLGLWETINNPNSKGLEFEAFRKRAGSPGFNLSPEKWVKDTCAIGIKSSRGRYSAGIFAHKDIAFEFAMWISPEFKLYLVKEFQRLKIKEDETNPAREIAQVKQDCDFSDEIIVGKFVNKKVINKIICI